MHKWPGSSSGITNPPRPLSLSLAQQVGAEVIAARPRDISSTLDHGGCTENDAAPSHLQAESPVGALRISGVESKSLRGTG